MTTVTCRPLHLSATQPWAEAKRCVFAIHVFPIPTMDLRHSMFQAHLLDLPANFRLRLDHTFRRVSQYTRVLIVRRRMCKTLRDLLAMDKLSAFAIPLAIVAESAITVAQPLETAGCHPCLPDMPNRPLSGHLNPIHPPRATPPQTTVSSHSTSALALSLLSTCFHVLPSRQCHRVPSRTNNLRALDDKSQKKMSARFAATSFLEKAPKVMKQTGRNTSRNASPYTLPHRPQYHSPNKHLLAFPLSAPAA
jgi:hypothetical protein